MELQTFQVTDSRLVHLNWGMAARL
jgi:hypothetical protein